MRALVIIPTYNERENIVPIVTEVMKTIEASGNAQLDVSILVVDDNSPDGTGAAVLDLKSRASFGERLHLLKRPGKQGLGRAYIAGFNWGLENGFETLVEMDADFSHRPVDLVKLLEAILSGSDFVVGSRWVEGGGTQNWGVLRKIISRGGSLYSRIILGHPLNDWTGGFNAWRAKVLKGIGLERVKSEGYSFQIELKYRSLEAGFNGIEVPIWFEDRRVGSSKMSAKIVFEAFGRVWGMRFG